MFSVYIVLLYRDSVAASLSCRPPRLSAMVVMVIQRDAYAVRQKL